MPVFSSSKIRVGVIGCGQWGPNQIRAFLFHPKATVVRICDKDESRLSAVGAMYPSVKCTLNSREITDSPDIDVVVITTPVSGHFELAKRALLNGKDVLCEKPLTMRASQSEELRRLAERKKRILMVGHVFLFNPGILKLKELIEAKEVGKIYYVHAKRTNLGPVRSDVNSVYDLASHDISIFNFLLGGPPKVLTAVGRSFIRKKVEDVAFVSLLYPKNIMAHIHVSWLDPKKIREITVVGDKKMLTWDDLSLTGPVEVYTKHLEKDYLYYKDFGEFHLKVKEGETVIPAVKSIEPLREQANHFVQCILNRKKPLTDARFALDVVRTLEEVDAVLDKVR